MPPSSPTARPSRPSCSRRSGCSVGMGSGYCVARRLRSVDELDFDSLTAISSGPCQGPDAVDDPAAPADDPAGVLSRALDLDPHAAAVLLAVDSDGIVVMNQGGDDQCDEFLRHAFLSADQAEACSAAATRLV